MDSRQCLISRVTANPERRLARRPESVRGTSLAMCGEGGKSMGRAFILWLLGVPASVLVILWLFGMFR
jgi:hypothetical protein